MRPRILIRDAARVGDDPVRLDAERSHHLVRVLRLQPGAALECFDGRGARFEATLERADPRGCTLRIGARAASSTESPLDLSLLQCVSGSERMDWAVEKAVELGVREIRPLLAERSPQRLDAERAERRREHWRRLVEAACMQCGRDVLPEVHEVRPLERWLAGRAQTGGHGRGAVATLSLVLLPGADRRLRELRFEPDSSIELLVGPEAGLSEREVSRALDAGFRGVRLGPRTLRTETAGLAAIAALQALAGDF